MSKPKLTLIKRKKEILKGKILAANKDEKAKLEAQIKVLVKEAAKVMAEIIRADAKRTFSVLGDIKACSWDGPNFSLDNDQNILTIKFDCTNIKNAPAIKKLKRKLATAMRYQTKQLSALDAWELEAITAAANGKEMPEFIFGDES